MDVQFLMTLTNEKQQDFDPKELALALQVFYSIRLFQGMTDAVATQIEETSISPLIHP
jgi:hypothetical protein